MWSIYVMCGCLFYQMKKTCRTNTHIRNMAPSIIKFILPQNFVNIKISYHLQFVTF